MNLDVPARAGDLQIEVIGNPGSEADLTRKNTILTEIDGIEDICLVAGDFDGDEREDIIN